MRWAVVGAGGMLGKELVNSLGAAGQTVSGFTRANLDLESSIDDLAARFSGAEVIVNCVAFTAVDKAESELFEASKVNGIYAGKLAQAAAKVGAKFIHISTDYVFDGLASAPYRISDEPNPQSAYGESKFVGEQLVADSGANYAILRTSWLYGEHGRCFPKVIAGLLRDRESISVVSDQIGAPTWTRDLAEVIIDHGLNNHQEPIVHAVPSGRGSWFDFAVEIQRFLPGLEEKTLVPISAEEYPTPAKRPAWSVLDNSETKGLIIGDWRERWQIAAPEVLREFL